MYWHRRFLGLAGVSASFLLAYLLLSQPRIVFFSRAGFVAWYPAIGLVMALLLGLGPRYAFLVAVSAALADRVLYAQPFISFSGALDAAGIAVCYGLAAYLLRGPFQIDLRLRRRSDVVRYLFVNAISALAATIVGVGCLVADHSIAWPEHSTVAIAWFLGDTIGLVGITPFLLVHVLPRVRDWLAPSDSDTANTTPAIRKDFTFGQLLEACGQALMIIIVCWVVFGTQGKLYGQLYICFVPIIWIAMRQGVQRVVTGLLTINFGIIAAMRFFPPAEAAFPKIGLFMLMLSAVGLMIGSEVSERQRLAMEMNQQATFLDSLIQHNPLGIVVLNRERQVELANTAYYKLFLYEDQPESSVTNAHVPRADDPDFTQLVHDIFAGKTVRKTVQKQRTDGKCLDVALHGVPLVLNKEVRGAYLIYEDISEQTAALITERRHAESLDLLVKELELRTRQMASLNEMGALLECSASIQDASVVVAASLQKIFPEARSGALHLFRSSRNLIETAACWGRVGTSEVSFVPDACWSLRRGQAHWSEPQECGVSCSHLTRSSDALYLCVPMVAQGNTIGILCLEFEYKDEVKHHTSVDSIPNSRQRLAGSAASQIALSLASLQLRETLREQSIRDPLTHLFNRRFLEESLERELQLAIRKKQVLTLLFLDLDHFKRFNDTFGHDAGDLVLQSLANLLRTFFRATDICCRYGGEEFAVILPESSAQNVALRANALRAEVKNLHLQYRSQTLGQLTLSAGIASFPEHGLTFHDLLKVADKCLYESKARGRDIVTVASPKSFATACAP